MSGTPGGGGGASGAANGPWRGASEVFRRDLLEPSIEDGVYIPGTLEGGGYVVSNNRRNLAPEFAAKGTTEPFVSNLGEGSGQTLGGYSHLLDIEVRGLDPSVDEAATAQSHQQKIKDEQGA